LLEQGLPGKLPDPTAAYEGVSPAENMIAHVIDVGANYWSFWNFHQISAKNLMSYYQAYPGSRQRTFARWESPFFARRRKVVRQSTDQNL
jgi:hypothetical protein